MAVRHELQERGSKCEDTVPVRLARAVRETGSDWGSLRLQACTCECVYPRGAAD